MTADQAIPGIMRPGILLPATPQEHAGRRAEYEALCAGGHAHGTAGQIVFYVYTTDLDAGRGDVYVAAGLGLELVGLGYGVRLVPRNDWHTVESADIAVAMLPDVDPSTFPPGAWRLAWVRNETTRWASTPHLRAFDQVVASSQLSATRLAHETPRVHGVLPIGVDTVLFTDPAAGARTATAVTTANFWGTAREVHRALVELPDDADLAMYGRMIRAPHSLTRWHRDSISYFAIPDVYRTAALVIDDMNPTTVGYGSLNSRFFEAAASGALPLVNGLLGTRALGLPDAPHYRSPSELASTLAALRDDPEDTARRAGELQAIVRRDHSWSVRAHTFVDLVDQPRTATQAPPPRRAMHFFPDYSLNPYQSMLFSELHEVDAFPVSVSKIKTFLRHASEAAHDPGVLNVQWTAPILQWTEGPYSANVELGNFRRGVDAFQARGGRLLWTIHNVLPHDANHRWAEIELARYLADRADAIHIMSSETIEAVSQLYELDPAKTVVIEHSSYVGMYPEWISRAAAREHLGLLPEERVLIALGGIRPYKGLDRLLDVFDDLVETDPSLRLLVAGHPGKYQSVEDLRERCESHPRIVSQFDHVADDQLQVWMQAADLAILPYERILNSGAFLLAQTFGLPVVGPRDGALRAWEASEHIRLFQPGSTGSLGDTVRDALRDLVADPAGARDARASARAASAARPPAAMASAFAQVVGQLLDGSVGRPSPRDGWPHDAEASSSRSTVANFSTEVQS